MPSSSCGDRRHLLFRFRDRQRHVKRGAAEHLVLRPHDASMSLDNGPRDWQPHAHAFCFGGEERIEHLERLRQVQDETGGFTAFICWTFQPDHTEMADVPPAGSFEYLKTQAVSRLYLDNFPNIQSSWVTQGQKIGQLALLFGANDMGSLMIEENVVSAANTTHRTTTAEMERLIRDAGFIAARRRQDYSIIVGSEELGVGSATAAA